MKRFFCFLFVLVLLPVVSIADPDLSPVGRWTIASDYSTMHDNYMFTKTDFFLFADGSVYRVSITKNRKENDLSLAYDNGIWIGDASDLSLRVGKDLFKAYIDDEGFFFILIDENKPIKFFRVSDPEAGL